MAHTANLTERDIASYRERAVEAAKHEARWPGSTAPYELGISGAQAIELADLALAGLRGEHR